VGLTDPLSVDVRPVDAEVKQQVAVRLVPDLGMLAGNLVACHHHVRTGIPAE
jgi:hypothetical protein